MHLAELAWHIGNRHLAAAIEADRILILRDHVIKAMLEGLGATVTDIVEPFTPVRGAYSGVTVIARPSRSRRMTTMITIMATGMANATPTAACPVIRIMATTMAEGRPRPRSFA